MLDLFLLPETWATLLILIALEIVLSIDNLVFIAILANKLPAHQQKNARRLGLVLAVTFRVGLLSLAAWLVKLSTPLFNLFNHGYSVRDLVLIAGGLFLIWKSVLEIRERVAVNTHDKATKAKAPALFSAVIAQIVVIDIVFSIDSIITAVGLAQDLEVMVVAVLVAVGVMIWASDPLAKFINHNPNIVMLALAFLIMIGLALVVEGNGLDVSKGYLYTAMAFSLSVECLNMWQRRSEAKRNSLKQTD